MGAYDEWPYGVRIKVGNPNLYDLDDFQMLINLTSSNFNNWSNLNADGSDIRFGDYVAMVNHYIEEWNAGESSIKVWVKVPSIPANGSATIKVYYGNPNAQSESNGEAVFELFDDFSVPIDTEKWDIVGSGTVKALIDTVLTASSGDQGLAFDGEYWYWGHNNGSGVNGTIYKIDSGGNVVASFDGPPHAAGGDYRWDRGTILFSSGGDEMPVVWEISKDGQKLREWDFSGEGYNRGALVAYEGDNKILLFTSDSSGNIKIGEYVINDDGTWSSTGNEWSHSSLGTPQGLDYYGGYVYYLVGDGDGSSTKVFKLKLNADGTISVVASASLPDGYEAEGLVYYNGEIFFGRANYTIYKVSQVSIDISSYSTSIYSKDQFGTMTALVCKWRASSVALDYPGFGYGNKGSPVPDVVDDSYQGHGITIGKIHSANDYVQGRQTDDGTNRDETGNLGVDQSEYHVYEIRRYADHSEFYVDGELVASLDQNYPTEDLYVGIGGHTHSETGQSIADYIYVRKIAEQDPEISVGPEQSSDLQGWAYMREITITNSNSTELTDFQVLISLTGSKVTENDGKDLRFYSNDGQTELSYYVEEIVKSVGANGKIWVKVPKIPANDSVDLYLYYGNPNAQSESSARAVFDKYTDFSTDPGLNVITNDSTHLVFTLNNLSFSEPRTKFVSDFLIDVDVVTANSAGAGLTFFYEQGAGFTITADTDEMASPPGARVWSETQYCEGLSGEHRYTFVRNGSSQKLVIDYGGCESSNDAGDANIATSQFEFHGWGGSNAMTFDVEWEQANERLKVHIKRSSGSELTIYMKEIRVRKYADQEPVVEIGPEEQSDNPDWQYKRKITITNPNTYDLEDYQVLIELNDSNFDFSKANADGSDIRFGVAYYDKDEVDHNIEEWSSESEIKAWVKVPDIPANGSTTIKVYYGNPDAESKSDGKAVFDFFDDFEYDDGTWHLTGVNSVKSYEIDGFTKIGESPDVDCHQGVAASPDYYYTFHTDRIDKRSRSDWSVVSQNTNPFGNVSGVDHIGDGDYYAGKLYVPVEHWASETDWGNLHIFIYNADTLEIEQTIDISANGHEGSSITVVPEDNALYITEYKSSGGKIYKYSLSDFSLLDSITPSEDIPYMQGITHKDGLFYIASENGKLYAVKKDGTVIASYALVSDSMHNEGVDFDIDGKLLWLQDDSTYQKVYIFEQSSLLHLPSFSSNASGLDEGVYASVTIGENTIIETRMKISKTVAGGATGIYLTDVDMPNYSSGDDSFLVFGATDNGTFGIVDWKFDETSVEEFGEFPVDYNNFHVWTIKKVGNSYTLIYDGEEKTTVTRTTTPTDYLVFGVPYNDNELWVDWVRVRKYAEQDPEISVGPEQSSDLQGWAYMREITITNSNSTELTDFQVPITLMGYNVAENNGRDLRFYSSDGQTELPYYVEEVSKGANANTDGKIWVKVPKIPAGDAVDLYLYYGNPDAESKSDGKAVFEFYDDFDSGALDTTKWDSAGTVTISDGIVKIDSGNGYIKTKDTFGNSTLHFRLKMDGRKYNIGYGDKFDSPQIYVLLSDDGTSYGLYNRNSTDGNKVTIQLTTPDEFHWYELKFGPNESSLCQDGTNCVTNSSYLPDQELHIGFQPWGSYTGPLYVDTVFVRKYADQEPVVEIGPEVPSDMDGWQYMRRITVRNPNTYDLEDYQVLIELDSNDFDFSKTNNDGSDIRVKIKVPISIPYYIESFDKDNKDAKIWIRIPKILKEKEGYLTMYYGNPNAESESSADVVFDFFEDFDGTTLPSNWSKNNYASVSVSDSVMTLSSTASGAYGIVAYDERFDVNSNLVFDFKFRTEAGSSDITTVALDDRLIDGNPIGSGVDRIRFTNRYGSALWTTEREGTETTATANFDCTTWHVMTLKLSDLDAKYYVNYSLDATLASNIATDPMTIRFEAKNPSAKIYIDWVRARKYADQKLTYEIYVSGGGPNLYEVDLTDSSSMLDVVFGSWYLVKNDEFTMVSRYVNDISVYRVDLIQILEDKFINISKMLESSIELIDSVIEIFGKSIEEKISISGKYVNDVSKNATDSVVLADNKEYVLTKILSDVTNYLDDVEAILTSIRDVILTDYLTLTDIDQYSIGFNLYDDVSIYEQASKHIEIEYSELTGLYDSLRKLVSKINEENIETNDEFEILNVLIKILSETLSLIENVRKDIVMEKTDIARIRDQIVGLESAEYLIKELKSLIKKYVYLKSRIYLEENE